MNERLKFSEQELGHKIWTIVQLFYRSLLVFREQFNSYEQKVDEFARSQDKPRENLRLNPKDLAELLDFKLLERLRDGYLDDLKELCHQVFRGQDQTDLLDRYVSDIFHEISILKEEYYNVKTYAPLYERDSREQELTGILDEAYTGFPKLTAHINFLFQQAQARMEEHLASFKNLQIFVRSLYANRDDFVAEVYPDGLAHFYRIIYPLGVTEGYCRVGLSFHYAGFVDEAREAFQLAVEAYRSQLLSGSMRLETPQRKGLHKLIRSLRVKLRRIIASVPAPAVVENGQASLSLPAARVTAGAHARRKKSRREAPAAPASPRKRRKVGRVAAASPASGRLSSLRATNPVRRTGRR